MKTGKWVRMAGAGVLCIVVLFAAAGIVSAKGFNSGNETGLPGKLDIGANKVGGTEDVLVFPPLHFDAQYIRTDGYHEDARYPAVKLIRSVRELNEYYEANKEKYSLGRNGNVSLDTTIGFLDACDRYDDTYFEDHILVMVLLEEGSGSNRHKVRSVYMSAGGRCCICIDRIVPEARTCDMAEWHILIELEAGIEIEKESDITVFVDGIDPLTITCEGDVTDIQYGE